MGGATPNQSCFMVAVALSSIADACAQIVAKTSAMERGEAVSGIVDPNIGY